MAIDTATKLLCQHLWRENRLVQHWQSIKTITKDQDYWFTTCSPLVTNGLPLVTSGLPLVTTGLPLVLIPKVHHKLHWFEFFLLGCNGLPDDVVMELVVGGIRGDDPEAKLQRQEDNSGCLKPDPVSTQNNHSSGFRIVAMV